VLGHQTDDEDKDRCAQDRADDLVPLERIHGTPQKPGQSRAKLPAEIRGDITRRCHRVIAAKRRINPKRHLVLAPIPAYTDGSRNQEKGREQKPSRRAV
jgi:hypothetical protein